MYPHNKIVELRDILDVVSGQELDTLTAIMEDVIDHEGLIYFCGNGGSGATANLLAGDFLAAGIRALSLNANMGVLNHYSAHFGYRYVFSKQLECLGRERDLLFAISGSGNSANVLEAVTTAADRGMHTFGLTGMGGGQLSRLSRKALVVHSDDMEQIENAHVIIGHAVLAKLSSFSAARCLH
ncbi:phosphoheptose isomerase [Fontibacillus phaseoli]|uniref:Phosphoheptose isomerase n=1 Tax=Fontibacillus phaseoli TaxID=1416533 RepID=A0A369B7Q9_9BACL|nr:SIS domain-containing protein [Fontibacillus phaseoli]RCX17345.1 phosphoheptose isomerase [Fontibacillus phaseoli]